MTKTEDHQHRLEGFSERQVETVQFDTVKETKYIRMFYTVSKDNAVDSSVELIRQAIYVNQQSHCVYLVWYHK